MKLLTSLLIGLTFVSTGVAQSKVDFNRDIRPILADHCLQCHGQDEKQRKARLRLDQAESAYLVRKKGTVIVPKHPEKSTLMERVLSKDESEVMPPPETGKKPKAEQIELLRKWIAEGAVYQGHWAFAPPKRPALPEVKPDWTVRNPIDRFILARYKPYPGATLQADPATLIRRLYLDVTGLPPTIAEVDAFVENFSQAKYEALVDKLLQSPRFGERLAVEWLDAARFADTHGYHIDSGRDMTRWRDWVIETFNSNKPFDQFTIEQLAGDLIPDATIQQKIASGFHRNHMINFEGGAIPEEYQTAYVVDRVNTTGTVFLGLTIGCAQCHDHKYDPITQKEYYQLYAFFNNIPENGLDGQKGNAVPRLKVPSENQEKQLSQLNQQLKSLEAKLQGSLPEVDQAQLAWERNPESQKTVWTPLEPTKLFSRGRADLVRQADGTISVEGANAPTDAYTFTFVVGKQPITALKLDVFPDDRLVSRGPGRSVNGNFVMTGIRITVGNDKPVKTIRLKSATTRFSQDTFPVSSLVTKGKGWAIYPEVGKEHQAIFELAEPIQAPGQEVRVVMLFESQFAQHQFGRFKLSATDSATPHTDGGVPDEIKIFLQFTPETRRADQKQAIQSYYRNQVSPVVRKINDEIATIKKSITEINAQIPDTMVMQELPKPRDTFMLMRGQYDKKGEKVEANTPAALPPMDPTLPKNRLGLARWLTAPENPLLARVAVNRYWQLYFGTGLVKTSEDFGITGEWPSHPELLDWLAVEFRESGWNIKHLHRLILTSATYTQSSKVIRSEQDPENRLLGYFPRVRLPAEFIRDQALFTSGLLNGEIGGKSVSPYQPTGIWEELTFRQDNANFSAQIYEQGKGSDLYRRTMYTFWKRTAPPPSLITFDAPDREVCTVRRARTNTPLQALVLMNDPTYVEAARKFAERILNEGGKSAEEKVIFAFRTLLARKPSDKEISVLKRIYARESESFRKQPSEAEKLLKVGESMRDGKLDSVELAAWTMVATVLLNLDETITRN